MPNSEGLITGGIAIIIDHGMLILLLLIISSSKFSSPFIKFAQCRGNRNLLYYSVL